MAVLASFQHGIWLPSERVVQNTKAEAALFLMVQAWKSHTIISAINVWVTKASLDSVWKGTTQENTYQEMKITGDSLEGQLPQRPQIQEFIHKPEFSDAFITLVAH